MYLFGRKNFFQTIKKCTINKCVDRQIASVWEKNY